MVELSAPPPRTAKGYAVEIIRDFERSHRTESRTFLRFLSSSQAVHRHSSAKSFRLGARVAIFWSGPHLTRQAPIPISSRKERPIRPRRNGCATADPLPAPCLRKVIGELCLGAGEDDAGRPVGSAHDGANGGASPELDSS